MFKFYGSKFLAARRYPPPRCDTIVEPFAGSAAYAVTYRRTPTVVLIERDERVVDLWHRLLATDADTIRSMAAPAVGSASTDLLVAFASGRTTRDTPAEFTVTERMAQRFRPMVDRIASVVDECRHFDVRHGDYTDAPDVEATWFIDPPYQHQGGRPDRTRGGRYRYDNTAIDFPALAVWCMGRRGQVIVCEQGGADWLPWNGRFAVNDGGHRSYNEVWWTNEPGTLL